MYIPANWGEKKTTEYNLLIENICFLSLKLIFMKKECLSSEQ